MILTYDDLKHEYFLDGVRAPGVSEILQAAGRVYSGNYKEEHAAAGRAVHKATEEMDLIGTTADDYPEEREGKPFRAYLKAWEAYLSEKRVVVVAVEKRTWHEGLFYAGTMDRLVLEEETTLVLVDIKRGSSAKWHRYQIAAYILAENERRAEAGLELIEQGAVAYLKPNGRYARLGIKNPELADAMREFEADVKAYHERNKNHG